MKYGGTCDLPSILVLNVLNSATALNTANSEASSIGKAADDPGLPLQGTLQSLVELQRVLQVDYVDVTICGSDN